MNFPGPRLVVAALRGGAGKTTLSLGIIAAWRKRGRKVAPFKKGPDYIDAAWLSLAAGRPCRNLDFHLMGREEVGGSFRRNACPEGVSLVEGNRGLYDGLDAAGSQSTAELAKLLQAPVVLVLDCDKITRTSAAMVLGCQHLDPQVEIRGVILNRVAGRRHEEVLRHSVESACRIPVLGAVPRMADFPFPERHLGLLPPQEHAWVGAALERARRVAEEFLDLEGLWRIARSAGQEEGQDAPPSAPGEDLPPLGAPLIGVIKDSVFQFYYPENLEALARRARLKEISTLRETELPPLDGLYIGGGFPETHACLLAENVRLRASLRAAIEGGLPVYAECGGLMYLGESLAVGGREYPMVGALPLAVAMEKRPQGHGYTLLEVAGENPFIPQGALLRGHEFHYSRVHWMREEDLHFAFHMRRGEGIDGRRDGVLRHRVLATYSHLHALGTEAWAEGLVREAACHHLGRTAALAAG